VISGSGKGEEGREGWPGLGAAEELAERGARRSVTFRAISFLDSHGGKEMALKAGSVRAPKNDAVWARCAHR
jgi:hypothetical protein